MAYCLSESGLLSADNEFAESEDQFPSQSGVTRDMNTQYTTTTPLLADGRKPADLKTEDLRKELEKRGLKKTGKKKTLITRLENSLLNTQDENVIPGSLNLVESTFCHCPCSTGTVLDEIQELRKDIQSIKAMLVSESQIQDLKIKCQQYVNEVRSLQAENRALVRALSRKESLDTCQVELKTPVITTPLSAIPGGKANKGKITKNLKSQPKSQNQQQPTGSLSLPGTQSKNASTRQQKTKSSKTNATTIIGDSIIKGLQEDKMSSDTKRSVVLKCFRGATCDEMHYYLSPLVKSQPKEVVLHVGTNDLKLAVSNRK